MEFVNVKIICSAESVENEMGILLKKWWLMFESVIEESPLQRKKIVSPYFCNLINYILLLNIIKYNIYSPKLIFVIYKLGYVQ